MDLYFLRLDLCSYLQIRIILLFPPERKPDGFLFLHPCDRHQQQQEDSVNVLAGKCLLIHFIKIYTKYSINR